MVAHLEYAIGVLCLGGVAAVAVHTILETVGPNRRKIWAALAGAGLQRSIATAEQAQSRIVGKSGQPSSNEQQHALADHEIEVQGRPSTPVTAPRYGVALNGVGAAPGSRLKPSRPQFTGSCVVSASQVQL